MWHCQFDDSGKGPVERQHGLVFAHLLAHCSGANVSTEFAEQTNMRKPHYQIGAAVAPPISKTQFPEDP